MEVESSWGKGHCLSQGSCSWGSGALWELGGQAAKSQDEKRTCGFLNQDVLSYWLQSFALPVSMPLLYNFAVPPLKAEGTSHSLIWALSQALLWSMG